MNCAEELRRELGYRAEQYAHTHGLPHCLSYGQPPTVCFEPYDEGARHGSFLPSTYKAILRNSNWRHRLQKVHTQSRKSLPRGDHGPRRELDSCTSSDALLMNVFCCPRVFTDGRVYSLFGVTAGATPDFGFRARVPLTNGKFDRTEVDMRLGNLLVEAKLTESDFQRASKAALSTYRDFPDAFDYEGLPQIDKLPLIPADTKHPRCPRHWMLVLPADEREAAGSDRGVVCSSQMYPQCRAAVALQGLNLARAGPRTSQKSTEISGREVWDRLG